MASTIHQPNGLKWKALKSPLGTCLDLRKEELLTALLKLGIYVFPGIDLVRLFVDPSWELASRALPLRHPPHPHPGQRLSPASPCEPRPGSLGTEAGLCVLAFSSAISSFMYRIFIASLLSPGRVLSARGSVSRHSLLMDSPPTQILRTRVLFFFN